MRRFCIVTDHGKLKNQSRKAWIISMLRGEVHEKIPHQEDK